MFFDSSSATIHSSVYIYLHLMKWFLSSFFKTFLNFFFGLVSKNGVFSKEAKNAAVWILGGKKRQYNIAVYMSSNSVAKVKIFFCSFFINNFFFV